MYKIINYYKQKNKTFLLGLLLFSTTGSSTQTLIWTSDKTASLTPGTKVYMRLRLSSVSLIDNSDTDRDERSIGNGALSTGSFADAATYSSGEVEDYKIAVTTNMDYGDVPVSYEKPGGIFLPARQASSSSLFIGGIPDEESTPASVSAGANNNGSNGDGLDEDGVADPSLYPLSYNAAYSMSVKVTNTTGSTQTLYGWVDFDNNGTFEATEVATVNVPTGTNNGTVVLNWLADASTNTAANYAYVRLRLSANPLTDFSGTAYDDRAIADGNNNGGYGASSYGEIEDYKVSATPQPNTGAVIGSSGDAYLRGKYVEGGIRSDYGVFGARNNSNRPIGYHSSRSNNDLYGFIANQAKNNWQTYNGDYFTPGTPEEGFTVTIGSNHYSNNNAGSTYQVPGSITGIANNTVPFNGSTASTVDWEGSAGGIKVHHQYMITRNGLYIRMVTTLTNTSASTINDIYYLRNLDPDNNVSINGGNYVTTNTIVKQTSTTNNISRVSATQADGSYMSYYSEDPRAKVTVGGFSNRDAKAVYTGFTQTLGYTNTDDEAISIAFKIGSLAPGASTSVEYYYLLDDIPSPIIQTTCYKPGVTGIGLDTKMGITALGRAGTDNGNWPMVRKGAWMALEAQSKGFVINRVKFNATNQPVADDGTTLIITSPIEGMMVFDITNNCLKIYTTPDDGATFSWQCINTQTCPD